MVDGVALDALIDAPALNDADSVQVVELPGFMPVLPSSTFTSSVLSILPLPLES